MFYTMGEVSEMFDVSSSLIRYWEKHFSVIKPERNKKGNRLFTQKDIENFKLIYHLVKERGMTLEGAKKSIRGGKLPENREVELMERLLTMRSLLLEVREVLKDNDAEESEEKAENQTADSSSSAQPHHKSENKSEDKELFAFYEQNLF